ncbi:MAG TPA: LysR family transcriptional regulator [Patescibacteria group bacterium]|nr:LysR family transcriptional regulator [Patescibacteria group bacterium]
MDIRVYETFLEVARLSNITQAAEQLNFTQPAITAQIRMLEEHYGVLLFERIGKKIYITEAGRELITYAEKLLGVYNDSHAAVMQFSDKNIPIKIGASTSAVSYILSPVLLEFQKCGTGSVIVDICSNLPVTAQGLLDNTYDMAVVHHKIKSNQVIQFDLSHENLVWVASADLVAANGNSRDIRRYPFINFRTGCVYRTIIEEGIDEKDIHPVIEYNDAEAIKQAVLEGMGASILPYVLVESLLADGTFVELTHVPRLTFTMSIAWRKGKVITPALRSLLSIFAGNAVSQREFTDYLHAGS